MGENAITQQHISITTLWVQLTHSVLPLPRPLISTEGNLAHYPPVLP